MASATKPRLARLALMAIVIAVVAIIAWLLLHTPPIAVDTARVDVGDIEVTVGDDGIARVRDVYTVSAPVGGRLNRVEAEPGDPVVAQQTILARLVPADPGFLDQRSRGIAEAHVREAEAQRAAARAEVRRTEAALTLAQREYDRVEPLAKRGTAPPAALDRARAARDDAQAAMAFSRAALNAAAEAVAAARAELTTPEATARLDAVPIRAPVSGTVLQVLQESEAVVAAGTPLVEIGDPTTDLEVVADLLSTDAVRVRAGSTAYIEQWGGSRRLLGRVRRVEPYGFLKVSALGVEEQRVNVRMDLIGDRSAWRRLGHGYRVEVRIVTDGAEDVTRVPSSALFRQGKQWAVFVREHGRARLRFVEIGLVNEDFAQVRRGLAPGETVVLFPSETIEDGSRLIDR